MAVHQNWIYYLDVNDTGIYRMKLDGTETNNVISEKEVNNFFITGNQLYFIQYDTNELFQVDLSGAGKKKINDNISGSFIIEDGWSYYVKGQNLYKSSLDGTTTILLHSVDPMRDNGPIYNSLQYRDGWIYFCMEELGLFQIFILRKLGLTEPDLHA